MNALTVLPRRGFTMIEMLIVLVLAGALLALAAPSFINTLAKNRLEGVANELVTDVQFARSEAVARNAEVRLVVGAGGQCYTISVGGSCNCQASPVCSGGASEMKTVRFTDSGATATVATFAFDPVRGSLTGGDTGVTVSRSGYPWQLRADVLAIGRARICSPSGTFKGYPSC